VLLRHNQGGLCAQENGPQGQGRGRGSSGRQRKGWGRAEVVSNSFWLQLAGRDEVAIVGFDLLSQITCELRALLTVHPM
jgi:hypothetical protein